MFRASLSGRDVRQIAELGEWAPPTWTAGIDDLAFDGRHIFWDSNGTIGRMSRQGTHARAIIRGPGGGSGGAANHHLQFAGGKLYWDASGSRERLLSATPRGTGPRVLLTIPSASGTLDGL